MKFWPDEEDRDPRWVVTQIFMGTAVALLTVMNYKSDLKDWRVLCLMVAMWGGFALFTLRKPQFMKDRDARWRAECNAKIDAALARKEEHRLKGQYGDGI